MSYGSIGYTSSLKDKTETQSLLAESVSLSHSSEDISLQVGEKLRIQRETLEGAKTALGAMHTLSDSATHSIREIESKNRRKRQCLWFTIVALFLLNAVILSAMWRNGGSIFPPVSK
jgi:hypothetical protein